jgi:hypothetical protein
VSRALDEGRVRGLPTVQRTDSPPHTIGVPAVVRPVEPVHRDGHAPPKPKTPPFRTNVVTEHSIAAQLSQVEVCSRT